MKPLCIFIAASWTQDVISQTNVQLAYELARHGHKVIFLTPTKRQLEDHASNPAIYIWPSPRPTRLADAWFLFKLIRQYRPDCLIADGYAPVNVMLLVGWLTRVPYRLTWYHTLRSQTALNLASAGRVRRLASTFTLWRRRVILQLTRPCFIANSEASRRDVTDYLHLPDERCIVSPYALTDPADKLPARESPSPARHRLVCAARLSPEKGQDILLHAIALLRPQFPDLEVEFLGGGPLKEPYLDLARKLNIVDNCRFLGSVPHDQVLAHMASSALSVLPSRSEAFGIVVIEALAVGTPVVASSVGGVPDIIRDGIDGFLVPPENPEALAQAIAKVLSDPELRDAMSRQARQRFLSTYETGVVLPQLRQRIERMITGDHSPRGGSPT